MCKHALIVLMFVSTFAFAADENTAAPNSGTSTATARIVAPVDSKCPAEDRGKTAQATQPGCTKGSCTSARESARARLKGDVPATCENFIKADADCVLAGC